jgi:hypothetical protein
MPNTNTRDKYVESCDSRTCPGVTCALSVIVQSEYTNKCAMPPNFWEEDEPYV